MNGWTFLTIVVCVFIVCEAWHYHNGNETALWQYKTPEEKQLQQAIIERRSK